MENKKNLIHKILQSEMATYVSMGMISLPIAWSAYIYESKPIEPFIPKEVSYLVANQNFQKELSKIYTNYLSNELTSKFTEIKEEAKKLESALNNNQQIIKYSQELKEYKIKNNQYWVQGLIYPLTVSFFGFGLIIYNIKRNENFPLISKE